jgi:hypothetical protein
MALMGKGGGVTSIYRGRSSEDHHVMVDASWLGFKQKAGVRAGGMDVRDRAISEDAKARLLPFNIWH